MAHLTRACGLIALGLATPAVAEDVATWHAHIEEASMRFGVPAAWIERVMRAESGGRTSLAGRPIVSRAGAMGLMQLMPGTWAEMRSQLGLGFDPHRPRDNILAGTLYLRLMYDRFGYPGLFGAYNAGPARYAAHVARGRALPLETRLYMATVEGNVRSSVPATRASLAVAPVRQSLFFALGERQAAGNTAAADLFVFSRSGTEGGESQ